MTRRLPQERKVKMDLEQCRKEIDSIDEEIVSLIGQRLNCAEKIADIKEGSNIPVLAAERERQIIGKVTEQTKPEYRNYMKVLYSLLFELSRSNQNRVIKGKDEDFRAIAEAMENTPKLFPQFARVGCQGVEGAYSQAACERLFKTPSILYFKSFESVFDAVSRGMCDYGVLPIENSIAGSVKKVYDLMISHKFFVIRSARIKIDHCLLAKKGTELKDIREILTHEHAADQCAAFLDSLENVKVTRFENTASAARFIVESERNDIAAIASRRCAELYGLSRVSSDIQDNGNNYTRFVCISRSLEIYPGSDRTSIMMSLPHKPGALYKALSRFYALDMNLIKLESRAMPDRDFEYMFYFDVETSVYSDEFAHLMRELGEISEEFRYLGSYSEVVG
jgi:chorismate mutase/prephenate dehydratase